MRGSDQIRHITGPLLLAAPALLLIIGGLAVPIGRLVILALTTDDGSWTVANFATIAASRVERHALLTTFELGFAVTGLCGVLGVPFAFAMTVAKGRFSLLLMMAITLPFWTALLVRTYTWLLILQRHGLVNQLLMATGVINSPLSLVNNFTGTVIGMTHIMMPGFVLPVYAAFRAVNPDLVRASLILGASRLTTLRLVILPLAAPGIASGAALVFTSSLGFYVTPVILGGGHVAVLSSRIERNITLFGDWGTAGALGVVLLVIVMILLPFSYKVMAQIVHRVSARYA